MSRKRLLVLYFSGTGNTEFIAHGFSARWRSANRAVLCQSIEVSDPTHLPAADALAIGFPVYGLRAPRRVTEFIDRMPMTSETPSFVFDTHALLVADANYRVQRQLIRRGYLAAGYTSIKMPPTDRLAFARSGSRLQRSAAHTIANARGVMDRAAEAFLRTLGSHLVVPQNGDHGPRGRRVLDHLFHSAFHRFESGIRSRFAVDDRCMACGRCAADCPTNAIEIVDRIPRFSDSCMLCLRCLHNCPARAIQIGRGTVDRARWHGPTGAFSAPGRRHHG